MWEDEHPLLLPVVAIAHNKRQGSPGDRWVEEPRVKSKQETVPVEEGLIGEIAAGPAAQI